MQTAPARGSDALLPVKYINGHFNATALKSQVTSSLPQEPASAKKRLRFPQAAGNEEMDPTAALPPPRFSSLLLHSADRGEA